MGNVQCLTKVLKVFCTEKCLFIAFMYFSSVCYEHAKVPTEEHQHLTGSTSPVCNNQRLLFSIKLSIHNDVSITI